MVRYGHLQSVDGRMGIEYAHTQLLSLFAAIPPLIPTVNLVYASRWDMLHLIRRLPRSFLTEVTFLLTGVEPYGPIQDTHLPFNATPDLEKLTSGKLCDQIIMSVRSTHQPLPFLESDSLWGADGEGHTKPYSSGALLVNPVCGRFK